MTLFEECIEALGKNASIVEKDIAKKILTEFDKNFSLKLWGRIDWDKVKDKRIAVSVEEIIPILREKKRNHLALVYVIGSDPKIPIIKSKLDKLLEFFYDVEAVSPNSWFYCQSEGWVVEVYHDGTMTIGFVGQ